VVLAAIGLLIVLIAVAYERYMRPWLAQRFTRNPEARGNEAWNPASWSRS
jgi:hypothetical protein